MNAHNGVRTSQMKFSEIPNRTLRKNDRARISLGTPYRIHVFEGVIKLFLAFLKDDQSFLYGRLLISPTLTEMMIREDSDAG